MNAGIVRNIRDQLARIEHLSVPALKAEIRTMIEALPAHERHRLRTLAILVIGATREGV